MVKKISIGYIGFSVNMLQELTVSPFYDLKECIVEKSRSSDLFRKICETENVVLHEIANKEEMTEVLVSSCNNTHYIMYENGIIIDKAALPRTHIYNFHPGSFLNNRGANPVSWSILNGDFYTEMTMHEIDSEIDRGITLDRRAVKVSKSDDVLTLKNKLEKTIPELLVSLYSHILKSEYYEQHFNQYNKRVTASDYTIDLKRDTAEHMLHKVQSQRAYRGAILILDGEKIYIRSMKEIERAGSLLKREGNKYFLEIRQVLEASEDVEDITSD